MTGKSLVIKLGCAIMIGAVLAPMILSCKSSPEKPKPTEPPIAANPFTSDYQLDDSNIGFFTNVDSLEMLLSASPFYVSEQPLPSQKTGDFDQAWSSKVEDIKREAQSLVKTAIKLKSPVDKVRSSYVTYLRTIVEADSKLSAFATAMAVQVPSLAAQEAVVESQYNGLVADSVKNVYARSLIDYLKVANAVELGNLYLLDIGNLAQYASLALVVLTNQDNAAVKKANEKLDNDMKGLDGLRADAQSLAASIQKIDYGLRQLNTGSYYFARAANDFMTQSQRDLEAAADKLTPRQGLTKEDIQTIQAYLRLFKKWQNLVKQQTDSMDTSALIKVAAWHEGKAGIAYAASPTPDYASAVNSLRRPLQEDNKKAGYFAEDWTATRKANATAASGPQVQQLQRAIGGQTDVNKLVEDALINATSERYYNVLSSDVRGKVRASWSLLQDNLKNIIPKSGSSETTGTKNASASPATTSTTSAISGAARLTVAFYTGLVRDVYALANPAATPKQTADALAGIAITMVSGSKSVLNTNAVVKDAQDKIATKTSLAFVSSVMQRADIDAQTFRSYLAEATSAAGTYVRENASKEALAASLRDSTHQIRSSLAQARKAGLAYLNEQRQYIANTTLKQMLLDSWDDLLGGADDLWSIASGKTDWKTTLNMLGYNELKDMVTTVLGPGAVKELSPRAKQPQMSDKEFEETLKELSQWRELPPPEMWHQSVPWPALPTKDKWNDQAAWDRWSQAMDKWIDWYYGERELPPPEMWYEPTPKPAPKSEPAPAPAPVPAPKPEPAPAPTPVPAPKPAPTPTLTPTLDAARDLNGTWQGTGIYYFSDLATGRRVKTVNVQVTMKITQQGNAVTADTSLRVTKQDPPGDVSVKDASGNEKYAIMAVGNDSFTMRGTASATSLTMTYAGSGYTDYWTFSFTTDLLSGGFREVSPGALSDCRSDAKAFVLSRVK